MLYLLRWDTAYFRRGARTGVIQDGLSQNPRNILSKRKNASQLN